MKNTYISLFLIVLLLVGCASQRRRIRGAEAYETSNIIAPDTSVIPMFDASVLYILAREYENSRDTLRSMGEYVEERLIDLYPEKAYRGMMSKVADQTMSRLQTMRKSPQYRVNSIDGLTLSSPNESYFNTMSDSAEVELMQMTEAEASIYWELNALADSEMGLRLADIDSLGVFDSEWGLRAVLMGDDIPYFAKEDWVMVVGHHPIYAETPKDESERIDMQNTLGKVLGKYPKVAMYLCGHIHNFQHIRVPGSSIDYVVNSSASLSRKVKPIEGTQFCSPETGFSVIAADKKELCLHMIDKTGKVLYTVRRQK